MRIENPRSEEQIISDSLWPEAKYPFEIIEVEDTKSKKGNDMIVLTLNVMGMDGRTRVFKDYLVEAFALKLRRCSEACGLLDKYKSGLIEDADFMGKSGVLIIGQEFPKDGNPRNYIKDYFIENNKNISQDIPDDDMPF